jgi:prevent-host-death family protein
LHWASRQAAEAKSHLPQLLDDVERGETIVITRHGRAIARIVPEARLRQAEVERAIANIKALRRMGRTKARGSPCAADPFCTAALEIAAILCDLKPGDEVIMPSFTFVSTANAVVLRGAVPVFVDIDPETLNIDPKAIESAVTSRTRAIFVVHYAGAPCDMNTIGAIAAAHDLIVVEDAA